MGYVTSLCLKAKEERGVNCGESPLGSGGAKPFPGSAGLGDSFLVPGRGKVVLVDRVKSS